MTSCTQSHSARDHRASTPRRLRGRLMIAVLGGLARMNVLLVLNLISGIAGTLVEDVLRQ